MRLGVSVNISKNEMAALCEELENTQNPVVENFISRLLKKASRKARKERAAITEFQKALAFNLIQLNEVDGENPFSFWEGAR